ncbi:MAG: DNA methyltransferase, partial [Dehalococcoidia bacterium]
HRLRELVIAAFEKKLNLPALSNLYKAFCDTLVPDLTIEQFADMYAQTIAYGLFAARCNSPNGTKFTRQYARDLVPKTNPFLRNIFDHIAGAGLPEIIAPEVDDLAQLLAQADMASILKDFGKRTAKEDPVVHFYETFLAEYDPKVREMRGVYYTPEPVVSYIVRSIDHLLKTRFNKPQGLADDKTLILDPAVGTATFLYMVINEIHEAMLSQKQKGMWNDYVAEKLLPRIFGFELLMAPYAIAHLKLGLQLKDTGYQFRSDQRLRIYLTNTLEEAIKHSEVLFAQWISEEANAAAQIKKEKPIMVVLGNPPYSAISANANTRVFIDPKTGKRKRKLTWIGELIDGIYDKDGNEIIPGYKRVDDKPLMEKNPKTLQDDYVKFIRFGQWRIETTGQGILGFITNHSYLDNPTFRGMRQSLMRAFTDIFLLDLHGNVKRREVAPHGGKDDNVFDIQQGVAIGIFVKDPKKTGPARVYHSDLWGVRLEKYRILSETDLPNTEWVELKPSSPFYLFVPRSEEFLPEYAKYWKITEMFPINSVGIVTSRDHFVLDFDEVPLKERISVFRGLDRSDEEVRNSFKLSDVGDWSMSTARKTVRQDDDWQSSLRKCLYRPFDTRPIFYHYSVIERSRRTVMHHMLKENIGFVTTRQVTGLDFNNILCSPSIAEYKCISH